MEDLKCPDKCPDCGRSATPDSSICRRCGYRFPQPSWLASPPAHSGPTRDLTSSGSDPFAETIQSTRLRVSGERGERLLHLLDGETVVIGSASGPVSDLCGDNISRTHALIHQSGGRITVTDVGTRGSGSTNGTYVDGIRLGASIPVIVEPGSMITCATDPPLILRIEQEVES